MRLLLYSCTAPLCVIIANTLSTRIPTCGFHCLAHFVCSLERLFGRGSFTPNVHRPPATSWYFFAERGVPSQYTLAGYLRSRRTYARDMYMREKHVHTRREYTTIKQPYRNGRQRNRITSRLFCASSESCKLFVFLIGSHGTVPREPTGPHGTSHGKSRGIPWE